MPKPSIHLDRWFSGLVTNRAATSTPFRFSSLGQIIPFRDALIDGSNMEISPANTLVRRPGFPKFNSSNSFSGETPKGFFSAILGGTLFDLIDTDQNVYQFTSSTRSSIYTKGTTAQSHYQQVGNVLYISDGNANIKWDGITQTLAGLVAPTNAPTISNLNLYDTVGASQTTHAWVPGNQYANTTGAFQNFFLLAPTGEMQWAVVPAGTTLTSQTSPPNWSAQFGVFGGQTKDGQMTWYNCGTIGTWTANTAYKNSTLSAVNQFSATNTGTTNATTGSTSFNWTAQSQAIGFTAAAPTTGNTNTLKVTGLGFAIPAGATVNGVQVVVYRAANRTGAISDVTVQMLKAGVAAGSNKAVGGFWPQVLWNNNAIPNFPTNGGAGVKQQYGSNTDLWGTTLTPTDVNNATFGFQFVANQGSTRTTSGSFTYPQKSANYNGPAGVTCVVTVFYTVASSDISGAVYAQIIQDQNGNLQAVKTSGTSGAGPSQPSWSTTIGGTTVDNGVTWQCLGTANQLPCLFSRNYAFGYHSSGSVNHLSTMSPLLTVQAPIIGQNVAVTGLGSGDTQVDRCDLYRTLDGGSLLLYDTSAPNVNGSTTWTIPDTALDTDLNILLTGPVAHANDPPPSGATLIAYHMGRMWAAVGNLLYFSAGPDCVNGDGNQAWPPANVFTFTGPINGLASTSAGLVVFTNTDLSVVLGGPQTQTFWVQPLQKNFGLLSANCLCQDGDTLYVYTSTKQLFSFSSDGRDEIGQKVAFTLSSNFDPSTAYIALYRNGQDQGLFITDGSSKYMRYNLNATSWDTLATPANGFGPIGSIDTAAGVRSLLSVASNFIVNRDVATFSDSGTTYSGFATVGSLVLSEPGEMPQQVKSIVLTSAAVGSALTVSVMPNEVAGSFTAVPLSNSDPAKLSGTSFASSTINMNEYQWLGIASQLPNFIKHVQVKITLPTESAKNEIYSLSLL